MNLFAAILFISSTIALVFLSDKYEGGFSKIELSRKILLIILSVAYFFASYSILTGYLSFNEFPTFFSGEFTHIVATSSIEILIILTLLLVTGFLFYLSLSDIKKNSIPSFLTILPLSVIISLNLFLFIFTDRYNRYFIREEILFLPRSNIIGGLFWAVFIFLSHLLSKKRGMGFGDVLIVGIIGFSVGLVNSSIAVFIGICFALIWSILNFDWSKKSNFGKFKLPFVPFLFLGFSMIMVFTEQISELFLTLFTH
ncbi:MAG TPA: hypothetical protein ENN64_01205 [bacterium]|nr:hypothetical protein [bacterium]